LGKIFFNKILKFWHFWKKFFLINIKILAFFGEIFFKKRQFFKFF